MPQTGSMGSVEVMDDGTRPAEARRACPSTDYDAYFLFEDLPVLREVVRLRDVLRVAVLRLAVLRPAVFRLAAARPPLRPPLRAGPLFVARPRPDPLFLPPWSILLTVAQARR